MRIKVPKFIDVESQIIGFLTLKQFLYLLAAGGILLVLWYMLTLGIFILIAIPIVAGACFLAFRRIGGQPLITLIGAMLNYITKPRLYVWKKKNG